ncbi:hypothetical protein niasHS_018198 [Heterodera schachtii]|uniref:Peptidase M41 domain-containing protein n=1 Tax=Heterodera schachtii TaxID=97005 RepID=A0ABD2I023_HETSC
MTQTAFPDSPLSTSSTTEQQPSRSLLFPHNQLGPQETTIISAMMMLSPVVNEMQRVAFHEAGHAAACARNKDCK